MLNVYNYDVVILGGGPAGLSAAIYSARANLKVAIVDINTLGGQPSNYLELDNYPGFKLIGGYELMEKFLDHALSCGVDKFEMQEIEYVDIVSAQKVVKTKEFTINAKSIIIATGASPKKLGITNEKEYVGRGVSYCAICDGGFYKDKVVAVIGGGNSAIEEALYLTKFASKVYVVHRRHEFRADKVVLDKLYNNEKIEVIYDSNVVNIIANDCVEGMEVQNVKTNEISQVAVNGIFVYIGLVPNINMFNGQLKQDKCGFIEVNEEMQTSIDGVYAVGDVRVTPLRQVITSASDGAIAAVYSTKYIENLDKINV